MGVCLPLLRFHLISLFWHPGIEPHFPTCFISQINPYCAGTFFALFLLSNVLNLNLPYIFLLPQICHLLNLDRALIELETYSHLWEEYYNAGEVPWQHYLCLLYPSIQYCLGGVVLEFSLLSQLYHSIEGNMLMKGVFLHPTFLASP